MANISRRHLVVGAGAVAVGGASTFALPALLGHKSDLPEHLNCRFVGPEDEGAAELAVSFNKDFVKVPRIRALPRDADAVVGLLRWARDSETPFAVRGGGHSFAGHSETDSLAIDMREMNQVRYNDTSGLVTLGGGTRLGEAQLALGPRDLVIAGGVCPGVGAVGLGTGGGIGLFSRRVGLLCDQFDEIDWIDANGQMQKASAHENADMFWAMRGGGAGSFGIVTAMRLRALAPGHINVVKVTKSVTPERAFEMLLYWLVWSQLTERGTTTHLKLSKYGAGRILVQIDGVVAGDREKALAEISEVIGETVHENWVSSGTVSAVQDNLLQVAGLPQVNLVSRSHILNKAVEPKVFAELINGLLANPIGTAFLNIETLGGAVGNIAPRGSAFPHRDAQFVVQIQTAREMAVEGSDPDAVVNNLADILAPHASGGIYVNYPEPGIENWAKSYWGNNLSRLMKIKVKYDPENVFMHAQSVPLA